MTIGRRGFLAAFAAGPLAAAPRLDRKRVSAISDEIARTPAEAIAFAKQYGLQWLELRQVPGVRGEEYFLLPEARLKEAAKEFSDNGIRISFLNTSMLKFWLPGTEPVNARAKNGTRFEKREEELRRAIAAAHILGCDKIRVFTFARVAEPGKIMPRIAEIVSDLTRIAERDKVTLLVENEGSQNVATCAETTTLVKMVNMRGLAINWDSLNGSRQEKPFPDGYELLPKKRILNVQIKGRTILPGPELLDWAVIFARLAHDGYKGCVGLETHMGNGPDNIQRSHDSMKEILRLTSTT